MISCARAVSATSRQRVAMRTGLARSRRPMRSLSAASAFRGRAKRRAPRSEAQTVSEIVTSRMAASVIHCFGPAMAKSDSGATTPTNRGVGPSSGTRANVASQDRPAAEKRCTGSAPSATGAAFHCAKAASSAGCRSAASGCSSRLAACASSGPASPPGTPMRVPSPVTTSAKPWRPTSSSRVKREMSASGMSVVLMLRRPSGEVHCTTADMPGLPVDLNTNGAVQTTRASAGASATCLNHVRRRVS